MLVRCLLLIPLVALALAACDGEPSAALSRPLPIDASAQDVLDGARDAMADVTSYVWTSDVVLPVDDSGNAPRVRFDGFWMAPADYQFVATWESEGVTTVIEHRWVEGRAFQRLKGAWDEVSSRDPLGVPRYDGHSEVSTLEDIDFSIALNSATVYQIEGVINNDDPRLGEYGPTTSVVRFSVSHHDLLLSIKSAETTLADGRISSQTSTFARHNVAGTINLPEGFTAAARQPPSIEPGEPQLRE